jgi:hypothetical protein
VEIEGEGFRMKTQRVSWAIAVRVFWAQMWRLLIFVVALVLLERVVPELDKKLRITTSLLMSVYWLWAVRESLTNDYKFFDIKITRRR